MTKIRTADLKPCERLLLDRRRRDETQDRAARRLKVSRYIYRRMEAGVAAANGNGRAHLQPKLGALTDRELLFLRRVRSDISLGTLAKRIGISRVWLAQMENGDAPIERLRDWWAGAAEKNGRASHRIARGRRRKTRAS